MDEERKQRQAEDDARRQSEDEAAEAEEAAEVARKASPEASSKKELRGPIRMLGSEEKQKGRSESKSNGGIGLNNPNLRLMAIQSFISVVVAIVIVFAMAPLKSGFNLLETKVEGLVTTDAAFTVAQSEQSEAVAAAIGRADERTSTVGERINTLQAQLDITTAEVATTNAAIASIQVPQVDITPLQATVGLLESSLTTVGDLLDELAATYVLLNARVSSLEVVEREEEAETGSSSVVKASIKSMSSLMFPTDNSTIVAQFKVVLENTSSSDLEDLVMTVFTETGISYSGITSVTLVGGGTLWQGYGWNASSYEFINGQWGLDLEAKQTKTLYLTLQVKGGDSSTFDTL